MKWLGWINRHRAAALTLLLLVLGTMGFWVGCQSRVSPPPSRAAKPAPPAPRPPREFRGVYVATVANIDWPSQPGLSTAQQQAELIQLLDLAVQLRLNAILFQVRPAGDVFYQSPVEPWSEFLTGRMGRAPQPFYDPLAFAITEAHRRGLELHAWVNPFRASHPKAVGPVDARHVRKTRPSWVRAHGTYQWIDPGEPAAVDYVLGIIGDIVRRYDIDGIHLDDYFYPYPVPNTEFPDAATHRRSGSKLSREDWRRDNINRFVQRLYAGVKQLKPAVAVGISPAGIWRSGVPAKVRGSGAFDTTYADSRLWLRSGWVDYLAPQLYWKISAPEQSFPELLNWWVAQKPANRALYPALFTSKVADGSASAWSAAEIQNQIAIARRTPGVGGFVHFSLRALREDRDGILRKLAAQP